MDATRRTRRDGEQALEMITEHLRNLMVIAACGEDSEILDLSEESRKIAIRQANTLMRRVWFT